MDPDLYLKQLIIKLYDEVYIKEIMQREELVFRAYEFQQLGIDMNPEPLNPEPLNPEPC